MRLLLCTQEQTLIGYLGMHGCYFKAIIVLTGMYIVLHLHESYLLAFKTGLEVVVKDYKQAETPNTKEATVLTLRLYWCAPRGLYFFFSRPKD